jgi:divalent metal cation (Fe/Co/Zn/Cd) transporter
MNETTTREARSQGLRTALWLVGGTLAYNVIEGVVAVAAGAEASSIALLGFGLDSGIECAAGAVLLWRLSREAGGADPESVERTEHRARRFVGWTFLALSCYIVAQSIVTFLRGRPPEGSLVGILLALASLAIMPGLAVAKLKVAARLGSAALRAEAKETLACSYLSVTLLVGLLANRQLGWWWADPAAALLMVPWLVREGLEGIRGEGCADDCH